MPHLVDLVGGEQRRVIARIAGDGQAPALDGVGEQHARPVLFRVALGEGGEQRAEVVPGQVSDQRGELVVGDAGAEILDGRGSAIQEALAHGGRLQAEQRLIVLVRHRVDPVAEAVAAWLAERRLERAAVLGLHDVPAGRAQLLLPLRDPDTGHHPVQRLPVHVDDPQHVAQAVGGWVGDCLPDVPLIEFGVTDDRDEPAARPGAEMRVHVAAGRGGEQRRGRAEADRAGGEVDAVGVLGPARVGLQPAERAQRGQIGPVQVAQQILNGVVDRRGVRLHTDPVWRIQVGEVQRRQYGDEAGARGLMTADLDTVASLPVVVGCVDDPGREPQHPLLDLVQDGRVVSDRRRRGGHVLHAAAPG